MKCSLRITALCMAVLMMAALFPMDAGTGNGREFRAFAEPNGSGAGQETSAQTADGQKSSVQMAPAHELTDALSIAVSGSAEQGGQDTAAGGQSAARLVDGRIGTELALSSGASLTLTLAADGATPNEESRSSEEAEANALRGLYLIWNKIPEKYVYKINDAGLTGGQNGFLHEYLALPEETREVVLTAPAGGFRLAEVRAFSAGALPDDVQVWEKPCREADVLLFSTHSDDEQLFFAGLLPYYALVRGAAVQVVYMTNHWDSAARPHEQLNGLWTVGIRNYPVISPFPDNAGAVGNRTESRETVLARAKNVYYEENWIRFQVWQIRRFRPQVIVGHDVAGEYRHGAHILNTDALMQAVCRSEEAGYDRATAAIFGTWSTPKMYLHLYDENPVVMDYDTPHGELGGLTPFEVSKRGYACHDSQQWTWFTDWMNKPRAKDIRAYSPCQFGLYRTTVGEDTDKNDLLENITLYAETAPQDRIKGNAFWEKLARVIKK